ncbi:SAM-dependent methyltransferase [Nocardia rhamnosiphila]|uniref:SAM-dependent methyltransferase n=3 Tax=Nocardia rhamnosiphila TaxID=426716 RepID=UPI0004C2E019|nr:SAM-dependent methyltransferase [Nocardia rhamnosiphila]
MSRTIRVPETGTRAPLGVDTTKASIARVYDYSLGGKDNYDVDRAAFEQVLAVAPRQRDVSRMNRDWLYRVVRYLAGQAGIDQFLDVGAGLPAVVNTHEVAQLGNRAARVVYVDNDPLCAAHGRAILAQNAFTHIVCGDLLEEGTLLQNREVLGYLEPDRPVGLIVCGLLHHLDDEFDPAGVIREYIERLPRGSYVAISHFWDPAEEDPAGHELAVRLQRVFVEGGLGSGRYRTREQIRAYFCGLELLEPGLVPLDDWWPFGPAVHTRPPEALMLGGLGYKPNSPLSLR